MLTGSGFLFPLHRAHPANQNGKAIHLRRVAVIIGSADRPTNRGPSQCLRFRTLPPNCPATSCFAIADCRTTRTALRSLSQCTRGCGAGSNLAAGCQPILESQRQSLLRQQQILVLPKAAFRRTIETRLEANPANPAESTLTTISFGSFLKSSRIH